MSESTSRPLFRAEALKWRQHTELGALSEAQPLSTRIFAVASVVLVVGSALFVGFGSYTRRVPAQGAMLPPGGLVIVEAPQGGTILKSDLHEGQHIQAGARLFTVDVQAWSDLGPVGRQSLATLRAQHALLVQRRTILQKDAPVELRSYRDQMGFLERQQAMLNTQIARDDETLPLIQRAMNEMRTAIGTHLVTESQFQGQLSSYVQFMNTHSQTLRSLIETGGQMSDLQYKITRHDFKVDEDLNDLDVRITDLERQITQVSGQADIVVDAPVSGTIDGIQAYPGQRVQNGQPVARLLPDGVVLQADLFVSGQAIGFVRPGQRVRLKYAAYPYQRFGLYDGTVTEVTRAPLSGQEKQQQTNQDGTPARQQDVYRVRVHPDKSFVRAYGKDQLLAPGMAVEADIAIDQRRIYQWILDPVVSMADNLAGVAGGKR